jgi:two-component sensor histidine kinase
MNSRGRVRERAADGRPLRLSGTVHDVTARRQADDRLRASLREKEVLLKEIHHRVKNNLQIISSLLDLQSAYTDDPQAVALFEESRGRVRSMALIHERLYRADDLARVDFELYVRSLTDDLFRAYRVHHDEIDLDVEVTAPPLTIDLAIPCGLLINELVSNCLKHAFRGRDRGLVRVALTRDGAEHCLVVEDDGVGFPPGLDFRATSSLGLQLVTTLVDQLNGEVELATAPRTRFEIRFPPKG